MKSLCAPNKLEIFLPLFPVFCETGENVPLLLCPPRQDSRGNQTLNLGCFAPGFHDFPVLALLLREFTTENKLPDIVLFGQIEEAADF